MKSVLLFLISCAAFSSCAPVTPHLPIETSRHARGIKDSLFKKDKETKKELQALSHVPWGMYPLWKVHKYKGISIRPVPIGEVGVPVPAPMPSYQPQSSAGYSSPVAYDTLQSYKDHSPAAYQQPKNYQPQAGYGLVGYGEAQTKPIQHPSYRAPTQTPAAVPQMVNTYPNPAQLVYQSIPQQQHLYSQAQPIGQQATYGAANQNPSQQSYAPVQQLPQPSTSDSALQQAALLQKQHADALRTQQAAALRQQAAIAQQGQSGQQVHGQNTRPVISQQQAALDQQEQMMALQHQAALAQQQALLAQQQATAVQQGDAAQQDIAGKHGYAQTTNQRPIEQPQFVQQDQLRPSLLAQQQDAMAQRGEAGQQGYVQITNPRPIQQPNFFQQDQLQGQQAPLREPATVAPPFSELPEDFPRELDFTVPSGSIAPADHGSLPLEGEEEEEEDQWSPFEHNSGEDHTNWQEEPRNTRAWNK